MYASLQIVLQNLIKVGKKVFIFQSNSMHQFNHMVNCHTCSTKDINKIKIEPMKSFQCH